MKDYHLVIPEDLWKAVRAVLKLSRDYRSAAHFIETAIREKLAAEKRGKDNRGTSFSE